MWNLLTLPPNRSTINEETSREIPDVTLEPSIGYVDNLGPVEFLNDIMLKESGLSFGFRSPEFKNKDEDEALLH